MPTSAKQGSVSNKSACGKAAIILGIATVLWLAWYSAASAGGGAPNHSTPIQQVGSGAERAGADGGTKLAHVLDPTRARLEQLSERDMKTFYTRCSQEGAARRLDGGEAMACSIGYDVLLKKHFSGDFEQLLQWSRRAADVH